MAKLSDVVVILFGASGSGKSFYKKFLVSGGLRDVKSYTTREKRKDENEEYHFVSNLDWISLSSANKLVNCNNYHGNYYGVLLEDLKAEGPSVLISDISSLEELKGILIYLNKKPVFVYCEVPQDMEVLKNRHLNRGTQNRLKISKKEIKEFAKEKETEWWQKNINHTFEKLCDVNKFIKHLKGE